jgi:hypothetical protein
MPRALYRSEMPKDLAADYRERSDRCRRKAEESNDPATKAYWLKFAEQWLQLAEDADRKAAKGE